MITSINKHEDLIKHTSLDFLKELINTQAQINVKVFFFNGKDLESMGQCIEFSMDSATERN